MADQHRRVEPRSIVGTGMSTDPGRVEALQHEREKRERTWRAPPPRGFGEILQESPAHRAEEGEAEGERRRRRRTNQPSPEGEGVEAQGDGVEEAAPAPPRVPPDPRARALHALLERNPRGSR